MKITMEWLEKQEACNLDKYRKFVGEGIEVTKENVLAAQKVGVLNADWIAERVLSAPLLAEYERQRAPLLAEYEQQCAPLLAELV